MQHCRKPVIYFNPITLPCARSQPARAGRNRCFLIGTCAAQGFPARTAFLCLRWHSQEESLPLDLQPQRMEQRWLLLCQCPVGAAVLRPVVSRGGVPVPLLAEPEGDPATIGAAWPLTRREMKYLLFSIYPSHRTRAATAQVPTPTTGCIPSALRVSQEFWVCFWVCPESFPTEGTAWGRSVAVLAACNPLIPGNPIMSPRGCFQFWLLKK